jgi:hypothetical protein
MLIWADFPSGQQGLYGTQASRMLNGVWASLEGLTPVIAADPDPNIGSNGRVFQVNAGGTGLTGARFALPAGPTNTVGTGFRMWLTNIPGIAWSQRAPIIGFRTALNANIVHFSVLPNGALAAAVTASGGTPLGQTAVPVITANSWNHIEIKVERFEGDIEVRVNGVAVLTLTGLTLGANDTAILFFGSQGATIAPISVVTHYKDIVIWDGTGSEVNDFQGSVSVRDLLPDGDVAFNWVPSTGTTGWDLINSENNPDTTFITAEDPPPSPSTFSLTNLPDDVTSIRGLIPISRSRKTDGGDANLQVSISPDGTNWDVGGDKPLTTAYTYRWDVSTLSPATTAPWTPVEVNNTTVRVDRTL